MSAGQGVPGGGPAPPGPDAGAAGSALCSANPRLMAVLFVAVFGGYLGQTVLFPVLPPLARELGLSEFQTGLLISVSAILVVLASPVWGRHSDAWGRKPVLLLGMVGAALSLYAFAFVSQVGLAGTLSVPLLFALMLATRSLLFGAALAAVPVASQAYVADVTEGEGERTRGIAAIQAAQGLNLIVGPALGGLLAGIGLLAPLWFAPTLILAVAALVWFLLPNPGRQAAREAPRA